MQAPMEEDQVDPIPLVIDAEPLLAADEGEVVAELQQEAFHVPDQGLLQLGFGVLVFQFEKLQHERVLQLLLGRDGIIGAGLAAPDQHASLVLRQCRPLVELGADLAAELTDGPPSRSASAS